MPVVRAASSPAIKNKIRANITKNAGPSFSERVAVKLEAKQQSSRADEKAQWEVIKNAKKSTRCSSLFLRRQVFLYQLIAVCVVPVHCKMCPFFCDKQRRGRGGNVLEKKLADSKVAESEQWKIIKEAKKSTRFLPYSSSFLRRQVF